MSIEIKKNNYALITAAKNEARYIKMTLESVVNQTKLPDVWVLVDDGSTDSTFEIMNSFKEKYPFIKTIKNESKKRDFSSKVSALKIAMEHINIEDYNFIGNIDADVSFEPSYYESLLNRFQQNERLGICGGVIWEKRDDQWVYVHSNPEWCVGGATQLFRRECLKQTGFYPLLKHGGEDTVVEYLARHHGWQVTAFKDITIYHHKPLSSANKSKWQIFFGAGVQEYHMGTSFTFLTIKSLSRLRRKPYLFVGMSLFLGYISCLLKGTKKDVDKQLEVIIKKQQKSRLIYGQDKY